MYIFNFLTMLDNPVQNKNSYLGETELNHNVLLNPIPDYRYNKYIYRNPNPLSNQNINIQPDLNRSIKLAGNHIMK